MHIDQILLVENHGVVISSITRCIKSVLGDHVIVLVAKTLSEAEHMYRDHFETIKVILLDTRLDNDETTFNLARHISMHFKGPIVSISTNEAFRKKMMSHGCTEAWEKHEILKFLEDLKNRS